MSHETDDTTPGAGIESQQESLADTSSWPALDTPSPQQSLFDLPLLDRERPERTPLIPRWVYIGLLALVSLALALGGLAMWSARSAQIPVPDVTGLSLQVATTRLTQAGLEVRVTDRRFSAAPRDEVLEQTPAGGGMLNRGDIVELVISAGTDEFVMPDVVGDGVNLATGTLQSLGLVVRVETIISEEPSDTVLSTNPAPGAIVRTGDTVLLTVATRAGGNRQLRPFNMEGLTILIDPAPPGTAEFDSALEVARRLRSLLQASGANVAMLRSAAETAVTDPERAAVAKNTTASVSVGLFTDPEGSLGRAVSRPAAGTPDLVQRSTLFSGAVVSQLEQVAPPVTASTSTTETVLTQANAPWVRIRLGAEEVRADQNRLTDPRWADQIARAIYTAIGETFGKPLQ